MSERAQALEAAIRQSIAELEVAEGLIYEPATDPAAWIDGVIRRLREVVQAPAEGVSPQPDKLPTTLELSGTMPDIAHSRNCQCAECAPVSPVEPTPEPPTHERCHDLVCNAMTPAGLLDVDWKHSQAGDR